MSIGKIQMTNRYRRGFTLIEIMMSVVVFTAAVLISAGAVIVSTRMSQKVSMMRSVQDEARFLSEFISREVETSISASAELAVGSEDGKCNSPDNILKFCDVLKVIKEDGAIEYISLTPDSRGLQLMVEKDGVKNVPQTISSNNIVVKVLNIVPLYNKDSQSAIQIDLGVQENTAGRVKNFNSNKIWKDLYRPTQLDLRFVASNLSNIPNLSF